MSAGGAYTTVSSHVIAGAGFWRKFRRSITVVEPQRDLAHIRNIESMQL
jgi:hypothetical protein